MTLSIFHPPPPKQMTYPPLTSFQTPENQLSTSTSSPLRAVTLNLDLQNVQLKNSES